MKNSNHTPELKLCLVVLVFGCVLVYGLPVVFEAAVSHVKQYTQHRANEAAAAQWQKDSLKIEENYRAFQARTGNVKMAVSREKQLARFYGLLNESASGSGVVFNSVKPGVESETQDKFTAPFEVAANGGYHSFGKFIDKLEKSGFLVKVASLSIKSNGNKLQAYMGLEFMAVKQ